MESRRWEESKDLLDQLKGMHSIFHKNSPPIRFESTESAALNALIERNVESKYGGSCLQQSSFTQTLIKALMSRQCRELSQESICADTLAHNETGQ